MGLILQNLECSLTCPQWFLFKFSREEHWLQLLEGSKPHMVDYTYFHPHSHTFAQKWQYHLGFWMFMDDHGYFIRKYHRMVLDITCSILKIAIHWHIVELKIIAYPCMRSIKGYTNGQQLYH